MITRALSTSAILSKSDDKSLQQIKLDLDKVSKDENSLKKPKDQTDLAKYELPDNNPEIPKKHVFQRITTTRLSESFYTLEQAAQYAPPMTVEKYYKYPALASNLGQYNYALRSYENENSVILQFPDVTDLLIVGGGLVGSATAYYAKFIAGRVADVCVIDKDPCSSHTCTAISNGLISSQSLNEEVVRMAQLSKELIRALRTDILCTKEDFAKINYRPVTHLVLFREAQVEEALNAVTMQIKNHGYVEAKLPDQLETTFPFLRVQGSDVALGTHGNQDEALVDPIALRSLYRTLAQAHGASFIKAEALDFNMVHSRSSRNIGVLGASAMVARIDNGELKNVFFGHTLLCSGHDTPYLEAQAEMEDYQRDALEDMHFMQPKMRLMFTFSSADTPVINFPVITDTDGSQLICQDFAGTFKYYANMEESEKMFEEDSGKFVDFDSKEPYPCLFHRDKKMEIYFNNVVKPKLVNRIPVMDDAKFLFAQTGFENWNINDGSPVLAEHPYFLTIAMAGGFGNRMLNFAPMAGLAFAEITCLDDLKTLDIKSFDWDRVFKNVRIKEFPQILGGFEQF